jgi:hypothetical protein
MHKSTHVIINKTIKWQSNIVQLNNTCLSQDGHSNAEALPPGQFDDDIDEEVQIRSTVRSNTESNQPIHANYFYG